MSCLSVKTRVLNSLKQEAHQGVCKLLHARRLVCLCRPVSSFDLQIVLLLCLSLSVCLSSLFLSLPPPPLSLSLSLTHTHTHTHTNTHTEQTTCTAMLINSSILYSAHGDQRGQMTGSPRVCGSNTRTACPVKTQSVPSDTRLS